jgi:hypothetical protein
VSTRPAPRPPIASKAEAESLLLGLLETMDTLLYVIQAESSLVRLGRTLEAGRMSADKAEFARRYVVAFQRVQVDAKTIRRLAPELVAKVIDRHHAFRAELQLNMTVLATARAVAENVMQEIGEAVARQDSPIAYERKGGLKRTTARTAKPVALSRTV